MFTNHLGHSLRVLYMPPVYAVISFFSYRYFRSYTYYDLIETGKSSLDVPRTENGLLISS